MAKQSIDTLLKGARWSTQKPAARIKPNTLRKIESDLSQVVEAEAVGKPIPTRKVLLGYLHDTYGVSVSIWTLNNWIATLRRGESL